ncbi:MAG TPA: flagellar biosynthesis anti-sigma factor FlgM [Polyangiaceae bacterium]|nr:flagellar biosynthesis anti-sigma factor FlgM [Polyangiaceae bacterium]
MRIVDTYGRFNVGGADTARKGAAAGATPKADANDAKGAASSGSDAVTVSAQAHELAQKASATADAAKIEHLRGAVQNGTLQIDRQAIAKRIVDGG